MKSLSRVRLFAAPWTVAYQVPPSMGFSRQEYWSGLPLPSPGDLPNPGIELWSPTSQADAFNLWATREALICRLYHAKCWAGWIPSWNQQCWRNINNLRYADDTTLMEESKEVLKSLLMKVKEEREKAGLKLSSQKTKILAFPLITS